MVSICSLVLYGIAAISTCVWLYFVPWYNTGSGYALLQKTPWPSSFTYLFSTIFVPYLFIMLIAMVAYRVSVVHKNNRGILFYGKTWAFLAATLATLQVVYANAPFSSFAQLKENSLFVAFFCSFVLGLSTVTGGLLTLMSTYKITPITLRRFADGFALGLIAMSMLCSMHYLNSGLPITIAPYGTMGLGELLFGTIGLFCFLTFTCFALNTALELLTRTVSLWRACSALVLCWSATIVPIALFLVDHAVTALPLVTLTTFSVITTAFYLISYYAVLKHNVTAVIPLLALPIVGYNFQYAYAQALHEPMQIAAILLFITVGWIATFYFTQKHMPHHEKTT